MQAGGSETLREEAPSIEAQAAEEPLDAVIIGTGFGGLAMAARLKKRGVERLLILEKGSSVGGTWRDNHYPGSGCDVPSVLYSYSFFPKPDWTRKYPAQAEIHAYLQDVARAFDLERHIRFGVEVAQCRFDEGDGCWHVTDTAGNTIVTRTLVSAVGQLSRPAIPTVEGQDTFQGAQFHSARWRHDIDLTGKTVAVVGSGASAIQFLPKIAPQAKRLILFQRSPAWVFPKPDRPTENWERQLFRYVPLAQRLVRWKTFLTFERGYDKYIANSKLNRVLQGAGDAIIAGQIKDPELRRKLTPDYLPGCKRLLISNEWYPALARENVAVNDSGVSRFEADAVVDGNGERHRVDVIIYGTGFKSTQFLTPMKVFGLGGRDLHEDWKGGAEAYRGVGVPGFPNLFLMYGPNTNTHNSIIFMLEAQANYIGRKIAEILRVPGRYACVTERALRRYYQTLEPFFGRFAWVGDCGNWYRLPSGKIVSNWPKRSFLYWRLMRQSDRGDYTVRQATGDRSPAAAMSLGSSPATTELAKETT